MSEREWVSQIAKLEIATADMRIRSAPVLRTAASALLSAMTALPGVASGSVTLSSGAPPQP